VTAYDKASALVESRTDDLLKVVKSESNRLGHDQKQASVMLRESIVTARYTGKTEEELQTFKNGIRFEVSRILSLIWPSVPKETQALDEYNATAPKGQRVGLNKRYRVANGSLTAQEAIEGKQKKAPLDKTATPMEKLVKSLESVVQNHKIGAKDKLDRAACEQALQTALDNILGVKSKAKK
jgi:hypothetical protein